MDPKAAYKDFEVFIRRAPPRHRTVPDACYCLAYCCIVQVQESPAQLDAARSWYDKGLANERQMLPFHQPVKSPFKELVEPMMRMAALNRTSSSGRGSEEHFTGQQSVGSASDLRCQGCGSLSEDLKKCSRCKKVSYCSRECQKGHWKVHKKQCNS